MNRYATLAIKVAPLELQDNMKALAVNAMKTFLIMRRYKMKYWAVYKCQLCGKLLKINDSVEISYDELPSILGKVINNQSFINNPYLYKAPMYIPCKCNNGNVGLATFAGFMQDTSEKDKEAASFLNKLLGKF